MSRVALIQSRICGGGPSLHTILLSQGLSYRNGSAFDAVLLGGALEPGELPMDSYAAARGVSYEVLSDMRRPVHPVRDVKAISRLTKRLTQLKPTIVHTHTAKAGAVGRIAASLAGVPIKIHTFHGHVFEGYFNEKVAKAFIKVERMLAAQSDQILAISDKQKRDLVDVYQIAPEEKVRVVPLGMELEQFSAIDRRERGALRQSLGIPADAPVIAAMGRLVHIKRVDVLIDAFMRISERLPEAHLMIAGDGELRDALEAQAAPLADRIHFLGWRDDQANIYREADLFVLSSDNEGTPSSVIESVCAGVPVVATDVGGVADVLETPDCGALVPAGDAAALGEAMAAELAQARVLSAPIRERMARRYSHHRLVRDMESLYHQLVEQKVGARVARMPELPVAN